MKTKLIALTAFFLFLSIYGCQETDLKKKMLARKWAYLEFKMGDQIISGDMLGNPAIEFKNDGTYKVTGGQISENGTWQLKEDKITTSSPATQATNILVIKEITENKLVMEGDSEGDKVLITLEAIKP